jgi:hypothetical protein
MTDEKSGLASAYKDTIEVVDRKGWRQMQHEKIKLQAADEERSKVPRKCEQARRHLKGLISNLCIRFFIKIL